MTALTMGVFVVLPAKLDSVDADVSVLASASAATTAVAMSADAAPQGASSVLWGEHTSPALSDALEADTSSQHLATECPVPAAQASHGKRQKAGLRSRTNS